MNASGEFLISAPPRTLFGLRVCDLGWTATLGLIEGLISLQGNRTTLAFLDARTALRQAIDAGYRDELRRGMLLPSGGRAFGFLMKALLERPVPIRFSVNTFVPALLTFLEKGRRIGIAGEDIDRIEALRDHFVRHAPWHDIVAIAPDQETGQHFDLVIVDAPRFAEERRIGRRLASVRAGLVVMAGAGLSGFIASKPARAAENAGMTSVEPSFA
ncbi:hypothetical protein [Neorhizobium sp. DT-125]|uniref:hypothetical protein n=1 Tax=Neorhizobium sp. DT-125 TaxID=3396163 RepID=UPI003F1B731F